MNEHKVRQGKTGATDDKRKGRLPQSHMYKYKVGAISQQHGNTHIPSLAHTLSSGAGRHLSAIEFIELGCQRPQPQMEAGLVGQLMLIPAPRGATSPIYSKVMFSSITPVIRSHQQNKCFASRVLSIPYHKRSHSTH
eukprot:296114-Pelagomonas_calceolata.AAC.4